MKNFKTVMNLLLMLTTSLIFAQTTLFKGNVVDEQKLSLPGATVLVKGKTTSVVTDIDGNFEIQIPKGNEIITISYIGFNSVDFNTSKLKTAVIVLKSNSENLEEVVITALGIKKEKKRLGYSVQEVKGDLTKSRDPNVMNSLSGKVSGLIVASSAEFFTAPKLYLRGKQPLIVVDGVPLGTDTYNISPDDIESINVLKGANAAALYGSDGGNGAVQITTKRGTKDSRGFVVEFNQNTIFQGGFNAVPKTQNSYGPGSYGNYAFKDGKGGGINDADYDQWGPKFDGQLITQYDSPLDANGNLIPKPWLARGANNFNNFMETGILETSNLAIASQFDKGNVRFSMSHTYQKGINPNTKLNIYNFNLSSKYNFSEKTSIDASANFNFQTSPNNPNVAYGPNSYIYNMLIWGGADYDVRDLRNYWQEGKEGIQQKNFEYTRYNNPYFMAYEWLKGVQTNGYTGQVTLKHEITDNFDASVRTNAALENEFRNEKFPYSMTTYGREKAQGDYKEWYNYKLKSYTDFMLNYDNTFGDFEIRSTLGANINIQKNRNLYATTDYLIVPGLYTLSNTQTPVQPSSYRSHYETYGYYASTDFSYKSFLFLGATGRIDKDSRLPEKNNSFFYPSVSLSAVLSEVLNIPSVDFLKVRGSFAKVGSSLDIYSNLNTYALNSPFAVNGATYNPAYVNSVLSNENLKPAFNSSTEFGLETQLFHNKLGFDLTYYENKNGPQIFDLKYSVASGYDGKKQNGITTKTKGWELAVTATPVKTKDFRWNVRLNWSAYKEYLEEVYGDITNNGQIKIGDRVDAYYITDFMRTQEGQLIVGSDGKPLKNAYQTRIGYAAPKWSAGLANNIIYKNFSLDFSLDGRYGGKIEDYVARKMWQSGRQVGTDTPERANDVQGIKSYVADAVVVTGGVLTTDGQGNVLSDTRTFAPNATKIFYQDYSKSYNGQSAANIIDKTFFKLREVNLTYTFPKKVLTKTFINNASISLIGRNLIYFAKHKDIDLDQFNDEKGSPLQTPTVKSYGLNINLKF
ncbi:SusC/RagA family TonB-linked outer membrane protein [Flavobacterium cellulosilyticum]|uniref:SusC/RagA family TonB-linked outer membrane protein n=1 Tax=Flavobacterium cellulosilyticum TaxID=2541731 RepID=A0A4R5CCZ3_9FLAO|nr:SusC/RagA family TonB-linked outer membrane protein [Flavobacterium cellulosilyticum]TDD95034.1 SusC/RagA family TonB-linked outer membrane protein [Flavobacterium cellulosilyticum]